MTAHSQEALFQGSTLFISARSPFARRVRVAFHENGVQFTERAFDVFQPQPDLWKANPVARVPALILKDGRVLIDSNVILEVLYQCIPSPFMPLLEKNPDARFEVARWSAIATGVCEKAVEYHLETLRPEGSRDPEVFEEVTSVLERTFALLESVLSKSGARYLVAHDGQPTQADFDMATALGYLKLRHPFQWETKFQSCANYFQLLNARPSFQKTLPP